MSKLEEFDIENHEFGEYIEHSLKKYPSCWIAQPEIDKTVKFETLYRTSKDIEAQIGNPSSISKNDVVHYIGRNSVTLISIFNAIAFKRWIPVGSNSSTPIHELLSNIKSTHSRALFIDKEIWQKIDNAKIFAPELCMIYIFELVDVESFKVKLDIVELKSTAYHQYDRNELQGISYMFLTSGSTGAPKAIMMDYRSTLKGLDCAKDPNVKSAEQLRIITINCQPFPHSGGLFQYLSSLSGQADYAIIEGFEPKLYLDALIKYKANYIGGTPAILTALAKYEQLSQYNLSGIYLIGTGGSKINKNAIHKIKELTQISDKAYILEVYGSSECTFSHLKITPITEDLVSLGKSIRNTECKILHLETNEICSHEEEGEICIKSPGIMKGYFCDKEKTQSVLFDNGWYRTGDLGKLDDEGNLYITGRLKEVIKYRAFSVHASELENILSAHPAVELAAVIAKPHDEHGEIPVAFVVVKSHLSENDIQNFVAERVSEFKRIHEVYFIKEMPLNNGNKVNKPALKKLL